MADNTYTGKFSGSGKSPLADGNSMEDKKAGTGAEKAPKFPDYAGGLTAKITDRTADFIEK